MGNSYSFVFDGSEPLAPWTTTTSQLPLTKERIVWLWNLPIPFHAGDGHLALPANSVIVLVPTKMMTQTTKNTFGSTSKPTNTLVRMQRVAAVVQLQPVT